MDLEIMDVQSLDSLSSEADCSTLKKLNCDQVSWIMNALERLLSISQQRLPMASRLTNAAKMAALLEIMEVLGYEFEDKAAAGNALASFTEFNKMRDLE